MKSIRKIITAAAAAAVIATVGATTAFALSEAVPPVDGTNTLKSGTYMNLDYGPGYARTINISSTTRYCAAWVEARNENNDVLDKASSFGNRAKGESVIARVGDDYIGSSFNYYCLGQIHGGATGQAAIIESISATI